MALTDELDRPRVAGRLDRGMRFVFGALFAAGVAVFFGWQSVRAGGSTGPMLLCVLALTVGAFLGVLGVSELRRPVIVSSLGRVADPAIEGANLRWHPRRAEIVDEFQRSTVLSPASDATIAGAIAETTAGTIVARLRFDGAPFIVGSSVRLRFEATPSRGSPRDLDARFTLRCLREIPETARMGVTRIETAWEGDSARLTCEMRGRTIAYDLSFDVPADAPVADLLAAHPVYWELAVRLDGLAAPYLERFFVPVAGDSPRAEFRETVTDRRAPGRLSNRHGIRRSTSDRWATRTIVTLRLPSSTA